MGCAHSLPGRPLAAQGCGHPASPFASSLRHSPGSPAPWPSAPLTRSTHLQLVLMLLVDACEQLGFPPVEGVDEGITLGHQAGLKLHTVLLCERAHLSAEGAWVPGCQRGQGSPVRLWGRDPAEGNEEELSPQCTTATLKRTG